MPVDVEEIGMTGHAPVAPARATAFGIVTTSTGVLALLLASGAFAETYMRTHRADALLMLAGLAAATFLILRRLAPAAPAGEPIGEILDSTGAALLAVGMDGRILYVNPAAEHLLGYLRSEMLTTWEKLAVLAPGEGARLVREMEKLSGLELHPEPTPIARLGAYLQCLRQLPPSVVPAFDAQLRRKDGSTIPVVLHISALRAQDGTVTGLVAIALDQSATRRQEQAQRESQERYRDLFENSSEMIATLSPTGRFVYANPAWKRCFGEDTTALLALESFDRLFSGASRAEAAALFRRALEGDVVERAPLRHHADDGRVLDLELSLSQRHKAGNPLAVRCLLRDVTQQKQRENRLALQLAVTQIVNESASQQEAAMRVLEALCVAQGWDLAVEWLVDDKGHHLEFCTAWGVPGKPAESLIQESMGVSLPSGAELAGRAWREGRTVGGADLALLPGSPRVIAALRQEMRAAWAVPVRVGSEVLAVLEFYCRLKRREDREVIAAIELAAASLGQMLARTRERGRAEELSRQQKILLDAVSDGICGIDRHGRVTFINPAAARLLGSAPEELTGKPVHELLHGRADRTCSEDCPLLRAAEARVAAAGEETIYGIDGRSFPAEYVLTPIPDQGRFAGSVLSFRDISQRSALDRMKDEFISTVSHELRTPLTSIRGALGLLSSGILGQLNEKGTNLLRIALSNSDRLVRLINDILDLERIQSGREPLTFRPVRIADVVRQAIDGMQPVADAAGVRLLHDAPQVEIQADSDRLLQVVTNLLSNAIKFSPPNSTVSVMTRPGATGITLSIIDHGRGIPADKLEAIFGRFQQVDASDSRQKGGSGLGLAICRTIVHQHSGRIWAERNPVRGSTFRVFLPYRPEALDSAVPEMPLAEREATGA
ncbi:MAG: PAS domain S-box protein [Acidobacteriota bacterium]